MIQDEDKKENPRTTFSSVRGKNKKANCIYCDIGKTDVFSKVITTGFISRRKRERNEMVQVVNNFSYPITDRLGILYKGH